MENLQNTPELVPTPTKKVGTSHHPHSALLMAISSVVVVATIGGVSYFLYQVKNNKDNGAIVTVATPTPSVSPSETASQEATQAPATSAALTEVAVVKKTEIKAEVAGLTAELKKAVEQMKAGL